MGIITCSSSAFSGILKQADNGSELFICVIGCLRGGVVCRFCFFAAILKISSSGLRGQVVAGGYLFITGCQARGGGAPIVNRAFRAV